MVHFFHILYGKSSVISYAFLQMLMSALRTVMGVVRTVTTTLAPTTAAVTLDIVFMLTITPAMVSSAV